MITPYEYFSSGSVLRSQYILCSDFLNKKINVIIVKGKKQKIPCKVQSINVFQPNSYRNIASIIIAVIDAIFKGLKGIKNNNPSMIVSSLDHPLSLLPAFFLSKITKVPWVPVIQSSLIFLNSNPTKIKREYLSKRNPVFFHLRYERNFSLPMALIANFSYKLIFLILRNSKVVITTRTIFSDIFNSLLKNNEEKVKVIVLNHDRGVPEKCFKELVNQEKKYDAISVIIGTPKRGGIDAIKIWYKVKQQLSNVKLCIAGFILREKEYKTFKEKTRILLNQLRLTENILFLNDLRKPLAHDLLLKKLAEAKLFLYTDVNLGGGMTIIEALACGTPVVSYYNEALIRSNSNAPIIFVEQNNRESFANIICNLLTNNKEYNKLRDLSIKYAKKFTWNSIAREEYNGYINALFYWYKRHTIKS